MTLLFWKNWAGSTSDAFAGGKQTEPNRSSYEVWVEVKLKLKVRKLAQSLVACELTVTAAVLPAAGGF